ncbi:MAG: tetratricopeptide repeat protein, partial [Armatimonadetes bacterium]|nr:tetratricopeptide repeat protein [Armatimonadota bacterium]NIO95570.1 tetratricopeptide repeat protein [Armatimonadota bacterium]
AYWSHIGGMLFGVMSAWALGLGVEGMKEYLMADARASLEEGATRKAAQSLRAVLASDSDNPAVHSALGRTYAMQQDPERAIPHYERSVQLYLDQGDESNAASCYEDLKRLYENARLDTRLEYRLALYMLETGKYAAALTLFEDIYLAHPGTPEEEISLLKIGDLCLKRLGEPRKAVEFYQRFLAEYPQSPWCTAVQTSLAEARKAAGM